MITSGEANGSHSFGSVNVHVKKSHDHDGRVVDAFLGFIGRAA